MLRRIIILNLCLLIGQPTLGMEKEEVQDLSSMKFGTSQDFIDLKPAQKLWGYSQEEIEKYISIIEEEYTVIDALRALADELTEKATLLAQKARAMRGNIFVIEEVYKEAEQTYTEAANAHIDKRNAELHVAKLEKALTKLAQKLKSADLAKEYKENWKNSCANAEVASEFIVNYQFVVQNLKFERKKKMLAAQEFSPLYKRPIRTKISIEESLLPIILDPLSTTLMDIKSYEKLEVLADIIDGSAYIYSPTVVPSFPTVDDSNFMSVTLTPQSS